MKNINDFQTFLRAETGMFYIKKFHPYFCISTFDLMMNYAVGKEKYEDIRCLEYLWKVFQEGEVDVNNALLKYKKEKLM